MAQWEKKRRAGERTHACCFSLFEMNYWEGQPTLGLNATRCGAECATRRCWFAVQP